MSVRAKFKVMDKVKSGDLGDVRVTLGAVSGSEGDNASWSKYTPSGELSMTITNPAAYKEFEVGKEFYLDFTPADERRKR